MKNSLFAIMIAIMIVTSSFGQGYRSGGHMQPHQSYRSHHGYYSDYRPQHNGFRLNYYQQPRAYVYRSPYVYSYRPPVGYYPPQVYYNSGYYYNEGYNVSVPVYPGYYHNPPPYYSSGGIGFHIGNVIRFNIGGCW